MGFLHEMGLPENRRLTDEEIEKAVRYLYGKYPELKKGKAAIEIAFGGKTLRQIAAEVFITERQLMRWKKEPDFIRQVQKYRMFHDLRLGILPKNNGGEYE
ncbi:MAG TPA: hypothetical protein VFR24_20165 [Candidatus Angelobacter sp.]|nr:hypothetical protein [Candidatus Angelobacter sp.]